MADTTTAGNALSLERYRRVTLVATAALCLIVLSGAGVRLTGSGLGCSTWPTCEGLNPVPPLELHGMVEFVNRLITGAVSLAVALAVLGAKRRVPYDPALRKWSWGLVAGVLAQIVWGGVTTLSDLHPAVVGGHFLISMVLIANAVILVHKASFPSPTSNRPDNPLSRAAFALGVWGGVVLLGGVVVTGTGPHAGDTEARRFGFELVDVVRVHSIMAWVLVSGIVALALLVARRPERLSLDGRGDTSAAVSAVQGVLVCAVAQGAIGYLQYFRGVPPLLVALHIVGAMATWVMLIRLYLIVSNDHTAYGLRRAAVDDGVRL